MYFVAFAAFRGEGGKPSFKPSCYRDFKGNRMHIAGGYEYEGPLTVTSSTPVVLTWHGGLSPQSVLYDATTFKAILESRFGEHWWKPAFAANGGGDVEESGARLLYTGDTIEYEDSLCPVPSGLLVTSFVEIITELVVKRDSSAQDGRQKKPTVKQRQRRRRGRG